MAWFKADDKLHEHRKVRMLGRVKLPAMGLWILCASWSNCNRTDGFVPARVARTFDESGRYARRLVAAGLWIEIDETEGHGEPGYRFHDWPDYQLSADDLEQRRKARAEAGRMGGLESGRVRRAKREANEANGEASASP